jgi:DNA polymerase-3 subunit delta'
MAMQCRGEGEKPCMECHSCSQMLSKNQPDVIMVTHEKPGSIGVEDVREQVNNQIGIKPYSSRYKIYIIDEAQKLTPQAQNSLLKTIEEPPSYGVVILLTSNIDMLLPTVVSRCVVLNMRAVENSVVKKYVMDRTSVSEYEGDIIVAFSNGNIGKAMRLASSEQFGQLKEAVIHLLKHISEMETYEIVLGVKNLSEFKLEINDCIDLMMTWFRDVLLYKITKNLDGLVYKNEYKFISAQASKASYNGIEEILLAMDKAKARLNANVNFDLAIELMFLTVKENVS